MAKKRKNRNNNHKTEEPEHLKSRGFKTLAAIVLGAAVAVVGGVAVNEYISSRERRHSYEARIEFSDPAYLSSLPENMQRDYRGHFPLGPEQESQGRIGSFEIVKEALKKWVMKNRKMLYEKGLSKDFNINLKELRERKLAALLDDAPDDYIEQAEKSIEAMLEFVKSPYLDKKDYGIIAPKSPEDIELEVKDRDKINIYILKNRVDILRYHFILGKTKEGDDYYKEMFFADLPQGTALKSVLFRSSTKEIEMAPSQNILISLDSEKPAGSFSPTPYVELLHSMIGRHTIARSLKIFEKPFKEGTLTMQQCIDIMTEEVSKEEVLVHSIAYVFTRKYASKTGLFDFEKEKENLFMEYDKGKYTGMAKMIPKIEKIGVQKAIQMYAENPDELFKGVIE
jgi:hypothetical protein